MTIGNAAWPAGGLPLADNELVLIELATAELLVVLEEDDEEWERDLLVEVLLAAASLLSLDLVLDIDFVLLVALDAESLCVLLDSTLR